MYQGLFSCFGITFVFIIIASIYVLDLNKSFRTSNGTKSTVSMVLC